MSTKFWKERYNSVFCTVFSPEFYGVFRLAKGAETWYFMGTEEKSINSLLNRQTAGP
jgi:hypothetical protein